MSNILDTTNGNLWAGFDNSQVKGDDNGFYKKPFNTQLGIRNNQLTQSQLEKTLAQFANNQNTNTNTQAQVIPINTNTGFDLNNFISENKWLLIGALVVVGYFAISKSGGGLAERSIVTRYKK